MDITVQIKDNKDGAFTINAKGRIDSETYQEFEKLIEPVFSKNAKNVLLDMAQVNYISSAGLGAVFNLMKRLRERGGDLLLCKLQPPTRRVFEIIKALPTENIFDSKEAADTELEHLTHPESDDPKSSS